MSFSNQLNNFLTYFKKFIFTYKDGFFEFPYLANSPQTLIASLIEMPFNKHDKRVQNIKMNNLFCEGELYYQELEEGIWVVASTLITKKNVCFNLIYDSSPIEYFNLVFHINESPFSSETPKLNTLNFSNYSWSFLKPNVADSTHYFKNSKVKSFTIYIHQDWLKHNVLESQTFQNSNLLQFINSERTHYSSDHIGAKSTELILSLFTLLNDDLTDEIAKRFSLKTKTFEVISILLNDISISENDNFEENIKKSDARLITIIDRELMDALFGQFPGIEDLSTRHKISISKINSLYKQVHGLSVFQFYQEKKMELGASLVRKETYSIKEIAHQLGYENASKFSAAFKKYHDRSPRDFIK